MDKSNSNELNALKKRIKTVKRKEEAKSLLINVIAGLVLIGLSPVAMSKATKNKELEVKQCNSAGNIQSLPIDIYTRADEIAALRKEIKDLRRDLLTTHSPPKIKSAPPPTKETEQQKQMIANFDPKNRTALKCLNPRIKAFLDVIAYSEGANYSTFYGGSKIKHFNFHPGKVLCSKLGGRRLCSSAAGRYQFLNTTWSGTSKRLNLKDFSATSQDLAAIELIRRRGALDDVMSGAFERAVYKCNGEWASLPGSPYGQPTRSMRKLKQIYKFRLKGYQNAIKK